MSPRARLVCHPDGDGAVTEHTALTLRINLPDTYSTDEVVAEIQQRLRAIYPLATITVEDGDGEDGLPIWHVHRDAYTPRTARPADGYAWVSGSRAGLLSGVGCRLGRNPS